MREIIQYIGAGIAVVVGIIGYIMAILRYISSEHDEIDRNWLFANLTESSGTAFMILIFFLLISFIF